MFRRVGLSRSNRPGTLLSEISNQKTKKFKEVDVNAPPVSSDDEADDENVATSASTERERTGKVKAPKHKGVIRLPSSFGSDTEEEEPNRRAGIKHTTFETSNSSNRGRKARSTGNLEHGKEETQPSNAKRRKLDTDDSDESKCQPKLPSRMIHQRGGENGVGKKKSVRATYGSKKSGSSQEDEPNKAKPKRSTKPKLLRVPDLPSCSELSEQTSEKQSFRMPGDLPNMSSPEQEPARFKHVKDLEDSDENESLRTLSSTNPTVRNVPSKESRSEPSASRRLLQQRLEMREKKKKKEEEEMTVASRLRSSSPPASFKLPSGGSDLGSGEDEAGGSKGGGFGISEDRLLADLKFLSDDEGLSKPSPAVIDTAPPIALCPWCGESVDTEKLSKFSKGRRLNVRMQAKFCHVHKKQTALEAWREKRYPEIDWEGLRDRCVAHHKALLSIVDGEPSYYRDALAEKIATGSSRSLKKEGNLNPGYYGPHGFNLMCDYLVGEFTDTLKEKAVSDRVIAGRGSAAFIQAVLVAELGVRLIQEDMKVSPERAREIMEESKEIGEMVHEDV